MGLKLGRFDFDGPYDSARFLFDKPAVFVILCKDIRDPGRFYVVDYDESDHARTLAMSHPRQVEWMKACRGTGTIAVAVMYAEKMTKEERQKVVNELQVQYNSPGGNSKKV
jgi:hypothetical protein